MESDTTFVAPEGVYTVIEEHRPSVLQNHAASTSPLQFPAKVSVITVKYPLEKIKDSALAASLAQLLGGNKDLKKEKAVKEKDDGISLSSSDTPPDEQIDEVPSSPTYSTPLFSPSAGRKPKQPTPAKWSKPKHNLKTTSSTFITRVQNAEGFPRNIRDRDGETTFFFYNQVKTILWVEAGAKSKEPFIRITFSSYPTCHSINNLTASPERLDVIIGFNTGDIIWIDPISSRYSRLNKGGCITPGACTAVRWVPGSASLFLASHADGTIVVYDRDREDGAFVPTQPGLEWDPRESIFVTIPPWHPGTSHDGEGGHSGALDISLSLSENTTNKSEKSDKSIKNPVSHWRVSPKGKPVVDFVFSPDVKYVGAISEDGCLRVIDALAEQLLDCYSSYFGALTCIAWSPDGRFVLAGGQDDLITIFSPWEQRVVARCQGHSSFVSCVAFDEGRSEDGRTYRFGSVGEDNKLILWDFSSGALHRPKTPYTHHSHHNAQSHSQPHGHKQSLNNGMSSSALYLPKTTSTSPLIDGEVDAEMRPRYHPAPSRNEIAVVQPVLVTFLPKHVLTSTKNGVVKLWVRPLQALQSGKPRRVGSGAI
ncbi:WD40-repeat-containing domain protein [Rhodocollybia butyracea]|uniref:WD40-repeat-containing domain protein n=1 Tax=Rhodocollybia butyracea TaxID=206335 RepID=A0A9P5UC24_9AGAR|nr:WD40-repeat-containing domain protein [Rhodocollybia butyracea]